MKGLPSIYPVSLQLLQHLEKKKTVLLSVALPVPGRVKSLLFVLIER
jgi:hypothetical protein